VVMPAYNAARTLRQTYAEVPHDVVDEVILVDGNSVDNTVGVSRALRPDIRVVGQDRPGKGAALRAGFNAARGDVIVMIDADRSMDPVEIERFLALIAEGYELVKGSRFMGDGGTADMERLRRFGNGVLRGIVNRLYGQRFTDLCYGFIAFRRDRLADLALAADGFEIETEIVVRSLLCGLRVGEVGSFESPRAHGASNLRTFRDGGRVLRVMLRERLGRGGGSARAPAREAGDPRARTAAAVADLRNGAADAVLDLHPRVDRALQVGDDELVAHAVDVDAELVQHPPVRGHCVGILAQRHGRDAVMRPGVRALADGVDASGHKSRSRS